METIIKCIENEILNLEEGHDTVLIDIAKAEEEMGFFTAVLLQMQQDEEIGNDFHIKSEIITKSSVDYFSYDFIQPIKSEIITKSCVDQFFESCNKVMKENDCSMLENFLKSDKFKFIKDHEINKVLRMFAQNGHTLAFILLIDHVEKDKTSIIKTCIAIAGMCAQIDFISNIRTIYL